MRICSSRCEIFFSEWREKVCKREECCKKGALHSFLYEMVNGVRDF